MNFNPYVLQSGLHLNQIKKFYFATYISNIHVYTYHNSGTRNISNTKIIERNSFNMAL